MAEEEAKSVLNKLICNFNELDEDLACLIVDGNYVPRKLGCYLLWFICTSLYSDAYGAGSVSSSCRASFILIQIAYKQQK